MSRKKTRTVDWKVKIDIEIAARIEQRLYDPLTRKPAYGRRSEVINMLLREWADDMDELDRKEKRNV